MVLWYWICCDVLFYHTALTQGTSCLIIFQNLNTSACFLFSSSSACPQSDYSGFHCCLSVLMIISGSKWKDPSYTNKQTSLINLTTSFNYHFLTLEAGDASPPEHHGECPGVSVLQELCPTHICLQTRLCSSASCSGLFWHQLAFKPLGL